MKVTQFVNPFPGLAYEMAWGPWGGTHRRGQNWQSGSAWDLLLPVGLPVVAPFDSYVVSVGAGEPGTRFAGAKVGLQGMDMSAFFTHLADVRVTKGQRVMAGDRIGTTGEAVGVPHTHIALGGPNYFNSFDSNGIDPRPFLTSTSTMIGLKGPKGYPWYRGNPVPPQPHEVEKITLKERLMASWFGGKSADAVIEKLKVGYEGDIPNPTDSALYRALRDNGFGHASAVRIVKATRDKKD